MAVLIKVRLSEVHQFTRIMQHRQDVCVCVRVPVCVDPSFSCGTSASLKHLAFLQQMLHSLTFFKSAPTEGAKQGQLKYQDRENIFMDI